MENKMIQDTGCGTPVKVGSRESLLAVAQSRMVMHYLDSLEPAVENELVTMKTTGDKILDRTLDKVGGKGLFVKELDAALQDGRADITVHSLKDMPMEVPADLPLIAFSEREDPRDVLVMPAGSRNAEIQGPIGTSSMRRALQLGKLYPGVEIRSVRGNLQTRLKKLDAGEYGALVLAGAGLRRLGLADRISRVFSPDEMIPAAGQGIVAVQGRAGADHSYMDGFDNRQSRLCAAAERAYVKELDGGCSSPIAAFAVLEEDHMKLRALYYDPQDGTWRRGTLEAQIQNEEDCIRLGIQMARTLRSKSEAGA